MIAHLPWQYSGGEWAIILIAGGVCFAVALALVWWGQGHGDA